MSETATPINIDVPIQLHPGALGNDAPHLQDTPHGLQAINAATQGMTYAHDAYAAIASTERLLATSRVVSPQELKLLGRDRENVRMVDGSPTLTEVSPEFADAVTKVWNTTSPKMDASKKSISGVVSLLEQKVAAAVDDPTRKSLEGMALAAEVRAHIKALPELQRTQLISQAIAAGDRFTVAAALHGIPFLLGISPETQQSFRASAALKFAPKESAELKAATNALQIVEQAHQKLLQRYAKIMTQRNTKKADAIAALAGTNGPAKR